MLFQNEIHYQSDVIFLCWKCYSKVSKLNKTLWSKNTTIVAFYAHRQPVLHRQQFCTEYRRIGPRANPIPSVHHWPAAVGEVPPTDSSCLRGRHSDLRVLATRRFCRPLWESVRLCRWGFGLDGVQSTAAESRQDWSSLVHIFSSTTSDPVWSGPHCPTPLKDQQS